MIVPTQVQDAPRPERKQPESHADDDYRVVLSSARARISQPPQPTVVPSSSSAQHQVAQPRPVATSVNAGIPRTGALRQMDSGRPVQASAGAPRVAPIAPPAASTDGPASAARRPEAEVVPMEVMDEIRSLRKLVEQHMAGFAWGETARTQPVKTEVMRQMLDSGFSPQFARDLLTDLPQEFDPSQAMAWVKGAADRSLMTIGNENDIVDRGGVYALVGPTGVGKTTTTAKLAARCVLRHGPSKVALVTTDGYRIGAHEQLRIYGRILGILGLDDIVHGFLNTLGGDNVF
jgi:flagellar biosynthesis protein FlhF